jgi:transposase
MAAPHPTAFEPYVHPDDPAGWLKPDEPLMSGGYDFSWCFVWYKAVLGHPDYRVGTNGTAWSSLPRGNRRVSKGWTKLKGNQIQGGYIQLILTSEFKQYHRLIHDLILEDFVGPVPPGLECRHLDGNPRNNHLDNLRWGTHVENMEDRKRHGRAPVGSKCKNAKITEEDVLRAVEMHKGGWSIISIAKHFGVDRSRFTRIFQKQEWTHVGIDPKQRDPILTYRSRRLSKDQVNEMLEQRRLGMTVKDIAEKNGISDSYASRVLRRLKLKVYFANT